MKVKVKPVKVSATAHSTRNGIHVITRVTHGNITRTTSKFIHVK